MKTKNLVIIFISFLLITLASGLVVFLTGEKERPVLSGQRETTNLGNQPVAEKRPDEVIKDKPVLEATAEAKPIVQPRETEQPKAADKPVEEKSQAVMLINGVEYRLAIKPASSVYDFMRALKEQNQIDFKGKSYSDMGFFIEEINGVRNNSAGENWVYYVNGLPAQLGISNYLIKVNDIIEWKYEKKSF